MVPPTGSKVNKVSFKIDEIEKKWFWSIRANDSPEVDLQLEGGGAEQLQVYHQATSFQLLCQCPSQPAK